jgi:hypothetical protein
MKYKLSYFNQNAGSPAPPNNGYEENSNEENNNDNGDNYNSNARNSQGFLPRHYNRENNSQYNNSTDPGSYGTSEDSLPNDPRNSYIMDPGALRHSGRKIKTGNDENNANKKISKFNKEIEEEIKKNYMEELLRIDAVKAIIEKLKQSQNDKSKELMKSYKGISNLQNKLLKEMNLSMRKNLIAKIIKGYNNLDKKQARVYMKQMNKLQKIEARNIEIAKIIRRAKQIQKREKKSKHLNKFLQNSLNVVNKNSISTKKSNTIKQNLNPMNDDNNRSNASTIKSKTKTIKKKPMIDNSNRSNASTIKSTTSKKKIKPLKTYVKNIPNISGVREVEQILV